MLQQAALEGLKREIDSMTESGESDRPDQGAGFRRRHARGGKILSVFETSTEVIRKGKASKPTEFGKMIKVQEAENQIVIEVQVYDERPSDSNLLIPSIETHRKNWAHCPIWRPADAGFYSAKNEVKAEEMGVKRVWVPNRSTKSAARRQYQKQRWFKKDRSGEPAARAGSVCLKRRHGLRRSLYKKTSRHEAMGGTWRDRRQSPPPRKGVSGT